MSWAVKGIQSLRQSALSYVNRRRLRAALENRHQKEATLVFLIFTPDIVHFAPYCVPSDADGFEAVLVLNSVSRADREWIRDLHPQVLQVSLKVSLSGNERSILSHGEVLNDLLSVAEQPFCIQDPDCFVTDRGFWAGVSLSPDLDFACGPFVKRPTHHDHLLPDTFFLLFNPELFRALRHRYRISATSRRDLKPAAREKLRTVDYQPGQYPEQFKGYFDTLQAFWLLAMAEGYRFRQLPGAGQSVFHIGGTSYLHTSDYDLAHWDYWPLSVIYFNLCLLQRPLGVRFRERFSGILERFQSPEKLLCDYPDFKSSRRFQEMQFLLNCVTA